MINVEALVCELLDAIDEGRLNEKTISQFSYWHLYALLNMTSQMNNGRDLFLKIKTYLENININRLKKQDKIEIAFVANFSSTWIGDELYNLFEKSEKFEPYVLLLSNHNEQSDEMRIEEYYKHLEFFSKRSLRILQTLTENGRQLSWVEIGIRPKMFVWLTPWIGLFKDNFYFFNYSLDTLHVYIPYAFMIADNERKEFVVQEYNQIIHNLVWENFVNSEIALDMTRKYAYVGDSNAVYTGYPKMDAFYNKESSTIWDDLMERTGNNSAKKIIYAPHQTIEINEQVCFSTFARNYDMILNLAEKYQDETVWVFKPHPILKFKAIKAGVFANVDEWNAYVARWEKLKNASIMDEGDYAAMFMNSDAMILDSASFLVEYLYTHKPLLFLQRKEQAFNEAGEEVINVHYTIDGEDEAGIKRFIEEVVLNGKDSNKEVRERFFSTKIDHKNIIGKTASENIFDCICAVL